MKVKLLFTILFLAVGTVHVSAQKTFQRAFGKQSDDEGRSIQQTNDGGYIITGYAFFKSGTDGDVYLVKTNSAGNLLWTKTYGGTGVEYGNSVVQTMDQGYIIAGYADKTGSDIFIVKTDSDGNLLWEKTLGSNSNYYYWGYSIQQISNGDYIVAGSKMTIGTGFNAFLMRIDSNGSTVFAKSYGDNGTGYEELFSVDQTFDGGFIATGTSAKGALLLKTSSSGTLLWSRGFSGATGYSIQETNDVGFIIAGEKDQQALLLKADGSGNLQWASTFGGTWEDKGYAVQETVMGDFVLAGYTKSFGFGNEDVYLIKADQNGSLLWSRTFGGSYYDMGKSVVLTNDGGYAIGGYDHMPGAGAEDVYLVKTDSNGNSGCNQFNPNTVTGIPTFTVTNNFMYDWSQSETSGTLPATVSSGGIQTIFCSTLTSTVSSTNSTCFGQCNGSATVNPTGGVPPYTFLWSTSETTQTITGLCDGTYTVNVLDDDNALKTSTITLKGGIILSSNTTSVSCNGNNSGAINLTVAGGSGNLSYSWSNGTSTEDISGVTAGSYTATVTDATCADTAIKIVTVSQPNAITNSISILNATTCISNDGNLSAALISGGVPPYSFLWMPGSIPSQTAAPIPVGNYTLTITDALGCTHTSTATVASKMAITFSNVAACSGQNSGSSSVSSMANATPPYTYTWSTGATTQAISGLAQGQYTATVIDANNCSVTKVANIGQWAVPFIGMVVQNASSCSASDGKITTNVGSGPNPYAYSWNPSGQLTSNATGLSPGTYTLTATYGIPGACTSTYTATVGCLSGVGEATEQSYYTIIPNPNSGVFTIETPLNNYEMCVSDLLGNELLIQESHNTRTEMDLRVYPPGIYFLRITSTENGTTIQKLVIQK